MTNAKRWSARVAGWRRSGLSAAEYAAAAGLNPRTLAWWSWRLKSSGAAGAANVGFVELVAKRQASKAVIAVATPATLDVQIGASVRVRVTRGFDAELLRAVVAALEPQ